MLLKRLPICRQRLSCSPLLAPPTRPNVSHLIPPPIRPRASCVHKQGPSSWTTRATCRLRVSPCSQTRSNRRTAIYECAFSSSSGPPHPNLTAHSHQCRQELVCSFPSVSLSIRQPPMNLMRHETWPVFLSRAMDTIPCWRAGRSCPLPAINILLLCWRAGRSCPLRCLHQWQQTPGRPSP